jgi:tetratricopeptide (TPR) repeat protein
MKILLTFAIVICWIFPCNSQHIGFWYGTENPDALSQYNIGWEYILDKGEWEKAEQAFRAAVSLDPNFHLGWSQVGRISSDPKERAEIFQSLKAKKEGLNEWEKRLLEVYLASLEIIDFKDRGLPIAPEMVQNFYQTSADNFSGFLKHYPDEKYVHAEYIEVIHGIYGAKASLDTLAKHQKEGLKTIPFLLSYKAQMHAELKEFESALRATKSLEKRINDKVSPIIPFTYGYIAFEKGDYEEASIWIERTLQLDPKHVIAQRLHQKIKAKTLE